MSSRYGMQMFKVNDLVMYGKTGVCRVFKIGTPDFAAGDQSPKQYYFLEPLYHSGTFYAPVEGANIAIRPIISANKAKTLVSTIKNMDYEPINIASIQQLSQYYQAILDNHKCDDLMSLIKSIYAKGIAAEKNNKKLGQIDKRYMKMAGDLLFGELAAALGREKETVEKSVLEKLKDTFS